MSELQVKRAILLGRTKKLKVVRNSFKEGWAIILPNGSNYHAMSDKDMVTYVQKY